MQEKIPNQIRPRANEIVTTAELVSVEHKDNKVIDKDEQMLSFDEYQTVLAVGSVVRDIKRGDVICINPNRFAIRQKQKSRIKAAVEGYEDVIVGYKLPIIETGIGNVLLITDGDIKYIVEDGFCEFIDIETKCNCEKEDCNTFSPYMPTLEDIKNDFANETV